MTTQITVLGLGQIGASIGLALAGNKDKLVRIGNDRDLSTGRRAEKLGAFDKIVINLHSAVENADIVILAVPVDELEDILKNIASDLKPGTVVVDTSPVKVPVTEMAAQILPAERYFVTMSSSLNPDYLQESGTGLDAAHADLFKNSITVITSPSGTPGKAVQLISDLTTLLGGTPFFADPYEADGLMAASDTLPVLTAAALLQAVMDQPGWREGRKLAGKPFAQATQAVQARQEQSYARTAVVNRENVLRVLDNLVTALRQTRDMIDDQDEEALREYLASAQSGREEWLNQRQSSNWNPASTQAAPGTAEVWGRLIGLRPRKDKEQKK